MKNIIENFIGVKKREGTRLLFYIIKLFHTSLMNEVENTFER